MILKSSLLCLIFSLICFGALAEEPATQPSAQPTTAPRPRPLNIDMVDGFGAQLWIVDKQFIEAWSKPEPPQLTPIQKISPGQTGQIVILFTGAKGDANGKANVTADVILRKPDGGVGYEQKDLVIIKDAPAPDAKRLSLGNSVVGFEPEKTDPPGPWMVEATVTDKVAGTAVHLKFRVEITAGK
jgi:hypothetical protein